MADVRNLCRGAMPLTGRLEPWQEELAADPEVLERLLEEHGSPVNILHPATMTKNVRSLVAVARDHDVALRVYFARKANKGLSFVEQARELGIGVDVASEGELRQALDTGMPPEDLVVTAAVKPRALLELALSAGATVVIDNEDELRLLVELSSHGNGPVAVRLAPRGRTTRFGMTLEQVLELAGSGSLDPSRVSGVHFHLDGYDAAERVAAIGEALELVDGLGRLGASVEFVDIGGGFPVRYLESRDEWDAFWAALESGGDPLTLDGHPLSRDRVYPFWQEPVGGAWLDGILGAQLEGRSVATAVRERGLELRCEPGRAALDGCGMTAARVEFRKRRPDGTYLVGLAMNRTQCRSTSEDFLVDPLLARPSSAGKPTEPIDGFLVGAYCIERELLTWRRLTFPEGVAVGDVVVFPNTAGYLMHILESASHQIPLARNVVAGEDGFRLDPIDSR